MPADSFTVTHQDPARLVARLHRFITAADVEALAREVLAALANAPAGTRASMVVLDLREVTGIEGEPEARAAMVRLQSSLGSQVKRTAYLADRPALRAFARRCLHAAGDDNAGIAATLQQVEDWLSLFDGRRKHQVLRMQTQFECVEKTQRVRAHERART